MPNLYQILNVDPSASTAEISEAAEKLREDWDPNVIQDRKNRVVASAVLREITEARDILTDPLKRKEYDVRIGLAYIVYKDPMMNNRSSVNSVESSEKYVTPRLSVKKSAEKLVPRVDFTHPKSLISNAKKSTPLQSKAPEISNGGEPSTNDKTHGNTGVHKVEEVPLKPDQERKIASEKLELATDKSKDQCEQGNDSLSSPRHLNSTERTPANNLVYATKVTDMEQNRPYEYTNKDKPSKSADITKSKRLQSYNIEPNSRFAGKSSVQRISDNLADTPKAVDIHQDRTYDSTNKDTTAQSADTEEAENVQSSNIKPNYRFADKSSEKSIADNIVDTPKAEDVDQDLKYNPIGKDGTPQSADTKKSESFPSSNSESKPRFSGVKLDESQDRNDSAASKELPEADKGLNPKNESHTSSNKGETKSKKVQDLKLDRQFSDTHKYFDASRLKPDYTPVLQDKEEPLRPQAEEQKDESDLKPLIGPQKHLNAPRIKDEGTEEITNSETEANQSNARPTVSSKSNPQSTKKGLENNKGQSGYQRDHEIFALAKEEKRICKHILPTAVEMIRQITLHLADSGRNKSDAFGKKGDQNTGSSGTSKSNSNSSFMSISASSRTKGTETKTIYTYDCDGEKVEVFVDGAMRVQIFKGTSEDSYKSDWINTTSPNPKKLCSSTVIDANGSKIKTLRICDGKQESISVHKDHILLCKISNSLK